MFRISSFTPKSSLPTELEKISFEEEHKVQSSSKDARSRQENEQEEETLEEKNEHLVDFEA